METNNKILSSNILLFSFITISIFFHIGIFQQPVIDWDERVYMYLSEHMTWGFGNYSTAGSFIAQSLPLKVYKSSVYYHPPLFPFLIKIVAIASGTFYASKILNIILIFFSIIYIHMISKLLSGAYGAFVTTGLWVICPIFNLESNIVHIDFPLTVFVLIGIAHFLLYRRNNRDKKHLILSGIFFSFAMLTKYTGPILVLIPAFLMLSVVKKEKLKDKNVILYGGIIATGFAWWIYIFLRFGTLLPPEFLGGGTYKSGYLISLAKRHWYHLWIYFFAICPMFFMYLCGVGYKSWHMILNPKDIFQWPENDTAIIVMNMSLILYMLIFSLINMTTNGFWIFRHIMPFFPICYITLGYMVMSFIRKGNRVINSFVLVSLFFTIVTMSFSTYQTLFILEKGNLKPIPAIMLLIPGINKFFF